MPIVAMRGGRVLQEKEFRAHLQSATRLENVSALLGAGASIGAGGKTIAQIWSSLRTNHLPTYEYLRSKKFVSDSEHANPSTLNLEEKIDQIRVALQEWRRQGTSHSRVKELKKHRDRVYQCVIEGALLDKDLWIDPQKTIRSPALNSHRQLILRLIGSRQPGQQAPWLFTTNYDLACEWAAESLGVHVVNGFGGFHRRTFAPHNFDLGFRNMLGRGEAQHGAYNCYLVKLHGSLNWLPIGTSDVAEVPAEFAYVRIGAFLSGTESWPGALVFPSAAKYVHTTGFLYAEIIRRFAEYLSRPQTLLVASGYSFGDQHINRILLSALRNPTLHIVVFLPELSDALSDPKTPGQRFVHDLAALNLPQVTFAGSGSEVYFDAAVSMLPEPALLDDRAEQAHRFMQMLERLGHSGPPPTATP